MKKMKSIVAALAIGMLIGSAVPAFAEAGDKIAATYVKYAILINGQEFSSDVDQLDINGTTYVPLRVFANMVGMDVNFKSAKTSEGQSIIELNGGDTVTAEVPSPEELATQAKAQQDAAQRWADQMNVYNKAIADKESEISTLKSNIGSQQRIIDSRKPGLSDFEEGSDIYNKIQTQINEDSQALNALQTQLTQAQAELTQLEQEKADLEAQSN